MSVLFFTADAHFGHANIAKFCGRPYIKSGEVLENGQWSSPEAVRAVEERMRADLVRRWNERVKPCDTVVHVGDFCNRGFNRGIPGLRLKPEEYEGQLNGKIVFIRGNHDRTNGLRHMIDTAVMTVGGRQAFVQHRPVEREEEVPPFCEFVICGHVHEKWRTKWVGGVLNINVGLDANGLMPLRQDEVVRIFLTEAAEKGG